MNRSDSARKGLPVRGAALVWAFVFACAITAAVLAFMYRYEAGWLQHTLVAVNALNHCNFNEAESNFKEAAAIARQMPDGQSRLVMSLNSLAELYMMQGKYAQAEPVIRAALTAVDERFGKQSDEMIPVLLVYGGFYRRQAQYGKAVQEYKQAIAVAQVVDKRGDKVADATEPLAKLYLFLGRTSEAEQLYERILSARTKIFGPDNISVAEALVGLGDVAEAQGRYRSAEDRYQQALAIHGRVDAQQRSSPGSTIDHLVALYVNEHELEKAEPLAKSALSLSDQDGMSYLKATILFSLMNLSAIYIQQGQLSDAKPLVDRAIAVAATRVSPEHPYYANALVQSSLLSTKEGQCSQAEGLLAKAIGILKKALGQKHRFIAEALKDLAATYAQEKKNDKAESTYKEALAMAQAVLPPEHPQTAGILDAYAKLLRKTDRTAEAEALEKRSREIMAMATRS